jgi:hypothetical protein
VFRSLKLAAFSIAFLFVSLPAVGQSGDDSIPRLPNGKPDLSGVWDHPRTADLTRPTNDCGSITKGCKHVPPPSISFTALGLAKWNDKASHEDWTARCLPWGYTRSWGTEYPVEIVQSPQRLAIMFESNNTYKIVPTDGTQMPKSMEPSWFGVSRGHWEGDTMVVETKGFNTMTYLDTAEHQHGEKLEVVERFQMADRNHMTREVTITDPEFYEKPFKYTGTLSRMKAGTELMEYVCMENNKWLERNYGKVAH